MLACLALLAALAADTAVIDTVQGPVELRPVVSGARDAAGVIDALGPSLPAIGACFPPSFLGFERVDVAYTIDAAGTATPGPASPKAGAPEIEACVRGVVVGVRYPPAARPSEVRLGLDRVPYPTGGGLGGGGLGGGLGGASTGATGGSGRAPLGSNAGIGGAHGPDGVVRRGADPVIVGALDRSLVDAAVEGSFPHLRYCHARVLHEDPSVAGELVVTFTVDEAGAVTSATVERTTANAPALDGCVARVFSKNLRFPERPGGGVATVSYPVIFGR